MTDLAATSPTTGDRGRRLRGAIARQLGIAILAGDHRPGDVLAGEVALAANLGVSRSAVREAIRTLAAKGLVESRSKAGTRVLPRARWALLDPDVLAWAFTGEPDVELVRQLFELRGVVEPAAAAFAAERRGDDDLAAMTDAIVAMRRHTLAVEAGRAADRAFHDAVLRATRNEALAALSAGIGAAVAMTTVFKQRARALPRDPVPDHERVLAAIASHDAEGARGAMRALVDLAANDTKSAMEHR